MNATTANLILANFDVEISDAEMVQLVNDANEAQSVEYMRAFDFVQRFAEQREIDEVDDYASICGHDVECSREYADNYFEDGR